MSKEKKNQNLIWQNIIT